MYELAEERDQTLKCKAKLGSEIKILLDIDQVFHARELSILDKTA